MHTTKAEFSQPLRPRTGSRLSPGPKPTQWTGRPERKGAYARRSTMQ